LKNNSANAIVKRRAEARLGIKKLKEDYAKRKAIKSCIICTLTNFKSQINRLENGIKFVVSLVYKNRVFYGKFYKRIITKESQAFDKNLKSQRLNDRLSGDSFIDFFNPIERAEH
jgi:hypothetical protein